MTLLNLYLKNKIKNKDNFLIKKYIKFYFYLQKKSKKQSRLFCFKTKRYKGFYKFFGLSRHSIKEFSCNEVLPGLVKSSW